MASFSVNIKNSYVDKHKKSVVIISYNHDYKSYKINTGIKVDPSYLGCEYDPDFETWKFVALRSLKPAERKILQEATHHLRQHCVKLNAILADLKTRKLSLSTENVKQELEKIDTVKTDITSKSMITWYDEYITIKEREMGNGINSYRSTFRHMKEFIKNKGVVHLLDITKEFLESFRQHLVSCGLASTTIHKQFKNLRFFLNWIASEDETGLIRIPKAYKKFMTKARYGDPIGLSVEQFFQLYQLNLSARPHLERTRDLFVFGVSIGGPRHGDLKRMSDTLRKSSFRLEGNTITYFENKTGNSHYEVMLNVFGLEILQKYNQVLPHVPCNQVMNRHLNEIAKILGWSEIKMIPVYDTYGKLLTVQEIPLSEIFSSKFMRKTAATIDNLLGVPTKTSMKRTGHKTFAAYSRYVDVNRETMEQANQQWDNLKILKSEKSDAVVEVR